MVKHFAGSAQSNRLDSSLLTLFPVSSDATFLLGDSAFSCGYSILSPPTVVEHATERIV